MGLKKELFFWSLIYILSVGMYYTFSHYFTGIVLLSLAVLIYMWRYHITSNLMDAQGIYALSWIGGQGLACLQLSRLQQEWEILTWLSFGVAYIGFTFAFRYKNTLCDSKIRIKCKSGYENAAIPLQHCMIGLCLISLAAFLIEYYIVGFIPLFADFAHAYSYFHVSGVHYFTVSCIFIPALSVLYFFSSESRKNVFLIIVSNIGAFAIPILCVSRFLLVFEVGFALIVYFLLTPHIRWRMFVCIGIALVSGYIVLSVFRNHDVEYLSGVFEMKDSQIPIFVSQPYIYIVNNYENFNCLVSNHIDHTWGLKMLFPVFALSGLKFVFPELVNFPIYITKSELNTYTMFYDSYYDFGVLGVMFLALIIGFVCKWIYYKMNENNNPIWLLLLGQILLYLGLSFFTTWFSLATTWFWFILTALIYLYIYLYQRRSMKS